MAVKTRTGVGLQMEKLEEAIHYVCSTCTAADRLGAVKLNKILFYSDMLHYASTGVSITGATYVKRQRGPVPKQVLPAIENLVRAGRLNYQNVSVFDMIRRQFDAFGDTNISVFAPDEIDRLNMMIRFVCDRTAEEVSNLTHTIVWDAAEVGEELPYETFLVSYVDELTEERLERAAKHMSEIERQDARLYA
jgi:hypothetical protein